jgi:hypothetical protein
MGCDICVVCFVKRYSLLTLICYVVFFYAITTCLDWPNDFKAVPIDQHQNNLMAFEENEVQWLLTIC